MPTELQNAFSKENLLLSKGFNPSFISSIKKIQIEKILTPSKKKLLPEVEGNKNSYLNYENLTVLFNKTRRLPFACIYGIDASLKKASIKRTTFRKDPRINSSFQLDNSFYDLRKDITEFEIGHMAAHHEMAWGENAQLQSYQTFHFTNSCPQAENLNSGLWKLLESYVVEEAASLLNNSKIVVITGPVLQTKDPFYIKDVTFQIPLLFYKVIIFSTTKGLFSTAFVMSHEQKMIEDEMFALTKKTKRGPTLEIKPATEFQDFSYKDVFQINIKTLENFTKLKFSFAGVTPIIIPNDLNKIEELKTIKKPTKESTKSRGFSAQSSNQRTTLILP